MSEPPADSLIIGWLILVFILAELAKLAVVELLDGLDRCVKILLVHADHDELAEIVRVHVRVGEAAGAREDLLDIGLVGQVAGSLLEHLWKRRERAVNEPRRTQYE